MPACRTGRSFTRFARIRSSAVCFMPPPRPASSCPSTTGNTGRACSSICRALRFTTWWSRATTWWSPPMAAHSGFSTTLRRCGRSRPQRQHRARTSTSPKPVTGSTIPTRWIRDPPSGQNPPAGILIDYYLPALPTGAISIDILDAQGSAVRHLTSVKAAKGEQPPEWPDQVHPEDTLPALAGHEPLCLESAL